MVTDVWLLWGRFVTLILIFCSVCAHAAAAAGGGGGRFVTGHAPIILKARTNGGVQKALQQFRDKAGSDVFWFRLTPLHANIGIGDPEVVRHILLHGDQKKYRKG